MSNTKNRKTAKPKARAATPVPPTDDRAFEHQVELYDTITLEIERSSALTGLLSARLLEVHEDHRSVAGLYALHIVADQVSDKLRIIADAARAFWETTKPAGAR